MTSSQLIRRGMLYIPASSPKMLTKSHNLAVDCAAYDLEDSVAHHKKEEARNTLAQFLKQPRPAGIGEVGVRINATDTKHALDDLTAVLNAPHLDTIMVPKVQSAADLTFVTDVIRHLRPADAKPLGIIALIETAKGLMNLPEICRASPLTNGLVFAAEDFCHDVSITRTPSLTELLFARSSIVTAARAFSIPSAIDLVTTSYRGEEGMRTLEEECADGQRLGFNGKQLIHPSQVEVAQRTFSPGEKQLEWAVRIVTADEKASEQGRGAWTMDGKMVDVPVVKLAMAVVKRAEACGMDVEGVRETWKRQEPE